MKPVLPFVVFVICVWSWAAAAFGAGPSATPVDQLKLLPGFQAELLYTVPARAQGSWVAMTPELRGRLITSDQYGKLYRVTPPPVGSGKKVQVEPLDVEIGSAQGLLYAFDSLYVMVNGPGSGLYRVRDTDGDDRYDDVKLLRRLAGGGEHGPHAVVLSPDGKSLFVCAGNHTDLPKVELSRVPRRWQEDLLLPRMWDARGHAAGKLAPGGWICRVEPDGQTWELYCNGFRNDYDIAFSPEGELFAYDADMEWDIGTPWYRPTRINHVTSGAEFGWRSGTGKWPAYYPDSLPSVVDIGQGSPTGITFGTGAKFPAKYQRALFICDWSYGVMYAVHLTPQGSSYTGKTELFATAAPLPLTDVVVNPADGALYFTIGGRRTQSGLYRITYTGDESTAPVQPGQDAGSEARALRRKLEALHEGGGPEAVEQAWPYLGHEDRQIRFAARVAIEHQPVERWQRQALEESNPRALIQAMIALARCGDESLQPQILAALNGIAGGRLPESEKLDLLRAYELAFTRMGKPSAEDRQAVLARLDAAYPAASTRLNHELSQLLIYLEAPQVVARTLKLLAAAPTQEEQIHYALSLRSLTSGWSMDQRREYFRWFNEAAAQRGGMSFGGFLRNIRNEAIATLTAEEKQQLKPVLDAVPRPRPVETTSRPLVKKWTVEELLPALEDGLHGRDFARGRKLFAEGACFKCHRFAGEGGTSGPDLTAAGGRFNARNLLESIVEPAKEISDQYQATIFQLEDGRSVVGRVVNLNGDNLMVITNLLDPSSLTSIRRKNIAVMAPSKQSLMPDGLLDTLTKEEILDLVAYLRSKGNPDDAAFSKAGGG